MVASANEGDAIIPPTTDLAEGIDMKSTVHGCSSHKLLGLLDT